MLHILPLRAMFNSAGCVPASPDLVASWQTAHCRRFPAFCTGGRIQLYGPRAPSASTLPMCLVCCVPAGDARARHSLPLADGLDDFT
jgi:hypothetical protein